MLFQLLKTHWLGKECLFYQNYAQSKLSHILSAYVVPVVLLFFIYFVYLSTSLVYFLYILSIILFQMVLRQFCSIRLTEKTIKITIKNQHIPIWFTQLWVCLFRKYQYIVQQIRPSVPVVASWNNHGLCMYVHVLLGSKMTTQSPNKKLLWKKEIET